MWVRAMHSYYLVCKVVAPKRAQLEVANAQFAEVMVELNGARFKLSEVQTNTSTWVLLVHITIPPTNVVFIIYCMQIQSII